MTEDLKEKTAKDLFWGGVSNGLQQLLNLVFGIFLTFSFVRLTELTIFAGERYYVIIGNDGKERIWSRHTVF